MTTTPEPPNVTLRWCPVCGRDDRWQPYGKMHHYYAGRTCTGNPVTLIYASPTRKDTA